MPATRQQIDDCGLGAALNVIAGKWKAIILWEVALSPRRFGGLKRLIPGVSEKVLIQQLRELEADGVVRREVFDEVPPRVEYSITESGERLNRAVAALAEWGKGHSQRDAPAASGGGAGR